MEKRIVSIVPKERPEHGISMEVSFFLGNNDPPMPKNSRVDVSLMYESGQISEELTVEKFKAIAFADALKVLSLALKQQDEVAGQ